MNRRQFLAAAAIGAVALAGGLLPQAFSPRVFGTAAEAVPRRPNFLFIFTDDQRWDAMGVVQREQGAQARFPWLRTPHMDRLAAEGVRFRNAFVVNSLCSPSRACFLTGRYNHLNGVANNRTPFPSDLPTHATLLRQAGYTTGYFGKWHMGEEQGGPRPGFDVSASYLGQGIYFDCPFEVDGRAVATEGWVDDVATDYALRFIAENREKPFSMVVGFKSAHTPCTPPEKYKTLYAGETGRPPLNATARPSYPIEGSEIAVAPDYDTVPRFLNYFRTLAGADDNLGRLLKALDEHKLAEDTVVIYSSDNGYFLGEHGLRDKRSAYEESLRIPLLLRYPRLTRAGTQIDEIVLNIDLAPTLLDLARVPIPAEMQGRSWKQLLQGEAAGWRRAFFYEYFFECNHPDTPTTTAVRTSHAKLINYPGHDDWTELYDLQRDPHEMQNLARDPAAKDLLARIEAEFERLAAAVQFSIPDYADRLDQEPPPNTRLGRARAAQKKAQQNQEP